jgi:tRNA G18 (ribose-2'-O)-methylase SpoU
MKRADKLVKIPMQGKTESLNVSVSTAVVVYEIVRQRYMLKK